MKIVRVENRNAIFGRMNIDKLRIHNVHNIFFLKCLFFEKTQSTLIVTINAGFKPLIWSKLVKILLLLKRFYQLPHLRLLLDHEMRLDLDWSSG